MEKLASMPIFQNPDPRTWGTRIGMSRDSDIIEASFRDMRDIIQRYQRRPEFNKYISDFWT